MTSKEQQRLIRVGLEVEEGAFDISKFALEEYLKEMLSNPVVEGVPRRMLLFAAAKGFIEAAMMAALVAIDAGEAEHTEIMGLLAKKFQELADKLDKSSHENG